MKKSVQIVEVEDEGFIALMDKIITVLCMNYFYTGKLIGVNDTCILLESPSIIYETGRWDEDEWKDKQPLPTDKLYIQTSAIESFGELK